MKAFGVITLCLPAFLAGGLGRMAAAAPGAAPIPVGSPLVSVSERLHQAWASGALSKEPVGKGDGQTAAELGIDVVAYHPGDVHGLKYGQGILTRTTPGTGIGPGYLLRVDPHARWGTDFAGSGETFVIRNVSAVSVAHAISGVGAGDGWTLNQVPAGAPEFPGVAGSRDYFYYRIPEPEGWICVAESPEGVLTTYVAARTDRGGWLQVERTIPPSPNWSGGSELWPMHEQLLQDVVRELPSAHSDPAAVARSLMALGLTKGAAAMMGADTGWSGLREEPSLPGAAAGQGGEGAGQSR